MKCLDSKIPGKIDIPVILLERYSLLMVSSQKQERQKVAAIQNIFQECYLLSWMLLHPLLDVSFKFLVSVFYGA